MVPWSPFRLVSPAGTAARLQVFIFHRVLSAPDPLLPGEPDVHVFDRQIAFIARYFNVLTLADAVQRLGQGTLPAAAACVTFDDGYADNRTLAVPILRRHAVPATFFIASGFIDGGRMWNDTVIEAVRSLPAGLVDWREIGLGTFMLGDSPSRVRAYQHLLTSLKHQPLEERALKVSEVARLSRLSQCCELMMTRSQVVELRELGMDVGGHTVNHPILARLGDAAARMEIQSNRDQLAGWMGDPPTVFAFPNGVPNQDYGPRDVSFVSDAGYQAAVSTSIGSAGHGADVFQIPRFTPWDRSLPKFGLRCAWNLRLAKPVLAL